MRYIQRLSWNSPWVKKGIKKVDNKLEDIVNENKLEENKSEESIFWKFKIDDVFIIGKLNENSIEILAGENPNIVYGVNFDGEVTQISIEINDNIRNKMIDNIGTIQTININEVYKPGDIIDNWKNFIEI